MRTRLGIIAALGSTQALAFASSIYLPAVLAAPIARGIGLTSPWVFAALSVGMGVSAILGPALGRRIDRDGGRQVLCASSVAFALGLGVLALASGPVSLFAAWLLIGVAMAAGLYESAFAAVTRLYGHDARGAITGITLIAGFASTIGWPLSAYLEHAFSWRGACLGWAVLHLCVGLPLHAWALRDAAKAPSHAAQGHAAQGHADEALAAAPRDRRMLLVSFLFTATGMVTIGIGTNLPSLFLALGAGSAAAIAAGSLLGPAQVLARLLEYGAHRRINPLISARMANALHPLAAVTVALGGAAAIPLFAILHGAGAGMWTICRGTLPLALFGPAGYGARIGRINAPVRIGQAFAPFLAGFAIERIGATALCASCACSLTALLILSFLSLPQRASRLTSSAIANPGGD